MQITTIGLDIAKNVFQAHGIDAAEKVLVRKQLRRSQVLAFFEALPPCLVGMEACATAHIRCAPQTLLARSDAPPRRSLHVRAPARAREIIREFRLDSMNAISARY